MNGQMLMTGKEIQMPVCKKLSSNELNYYKSLLNGVSEDIQYSVNWLNTTEARRLLKIRNEDEFYDEFNDSSLYDELNELFIRNGSDGKVPIAKFYGVGSQLAYKDLGRTLPFMYTDDKALSILNNYVEDLVVNVNKEVGIGIRDVLCVGAIGGLGVSKIVENLVQIPYSPIVSNVSVDTRCNMIARTEYGRAINTGTLQAYSNVGVTDVDIVTTGLSNVCDDCLELEENNPYTLQEAMAILPLHPNCACSYTAILHTIEENSEPIIIDLT